MAIITTAQNGNWSDPATWAGGVVPAATDSAVIAHAVTLTAPAGIVGITVNAGQTLDLNGQALDITGEFKTAGTALSRCTVKSTIPGGSWTSTLTETYLDFEYTDFSGLGPMTWWLPPEGKWIRVTHCTFNGFGQISMGNPWAHMSTEFTFQHSDFKNSTNSTGERKMLDISFGTNVGTITAERYFKNCTFDGSVNGDTSYRAIYVDSRKLPFVDCHFKNIALTGKNTRIADEPEGPLQGCAFFYTGSPPDYNIKIPDSNIIKDSYFFTSNDNPHIFSGNNAGDSELTDIVMESIYDTYTDSGDQILVGAGNLKIHKVISKDGKGAAFVNALGSPQSGNFEVCNNTITREEAGIDSYPGTLAQVESGGTFTGLEKIYHSNIVYNKGVSAGRGIGIESGGPDQVDYTDYNAWHNISDRYHGVAITGLTEGVSEGFGASDISADPKFVNDSAGIATFDASLGGTGTPTNAIAEFMKLNEPTYNTAYNSADLLAHVRAAYTPTNTALQGAGRYGGDMGALVVAASIAKKHRNNVIFW